MLRGIGKVPRAASRAGDADQHPPRVSCVQAVLALIAVTLQPPAHR